MTMHCDHCGAARIHAASHILENCFITVRQLANVVMTALSNITTPSHRLPGFQRLVVRHDAS
jgi:hypothetical protein